MLKLCYSYRKLHVLASFAVVAALGLFPFARGYASSYCEDESACCFRASRTALIIGGAAIVGGIAGAVAGATVKNKKSSNNNGNQSGNNANPITTTLNTGPTGLLSLGQFAVEAGQTLTFAMAATLTSATLGEVSFTPFITMPNGVIIEGEAIVPAALGTIGPITLIASDPVYGTYHAGLQIVNTSSAAAGVSLSVTVAASRDGSTTALLPFGDLETIPTGTSQLQQEFTYGPNPLP